MSEWKEYKLGDIADYINRGVTPSYSDEGVIVINQKCVRDGQVKYEQSRYTDSEKKKISEEKYLKSFDILINSSSGIFIFVLQNNFYIIFTIIYKYNI